MGKEKEKCFLEFLAQIAVTAKSVDNVLLMLKVMMSIRVETKNWKNSADFLDCFVSGLKITYHNL